MLKGPSHIPEDSQPDSLILFLHGWGSNGSDMFGIAQIFAKELPNTIMLSPDAQEKHPQVNEGYQWFSLDVDPEEKNDQNAKQIAGMNGVNKALPFIEEYLLHNVKKYNIPFNKVTVIGFSQGCMMAIHLGLRLRETIGAVVAFSGKLINSKGIDDFLVSKPPVLLIHGDDDEVVSPHFSRIASEILTKKDVSNLYVPLQGLAHSIDVRGLDTALSFVRKNIFSITS